MRMRKSKQVL